MLHNLNIPVVMAWSQAMLEWPTIEPADMPCPTLWLVGSDDSDAMASVREYEGRWQTRRCRFTSLKGWITSRPSMKSSKFFPPCWPLHRCSRRMESWLYGWRKYA